MKVSFDGLRRNIAQDFNEVVDIVGLLQEAKTDHDVRRGLDGVVRDLNTLRKSLGCLMACYDSKEMPDDFNDLSDQIKLNGI